MGGGTQLQITLSQWLCLFSDLRASVPPSHLCAHTLVHTHAGTAVQTTVEICKTLKIQYKTLNVIVINSAGLGPGAWVVLSLQF